MPEASPRSTQPGFLDFDTREVRLACVAVIGIAVLALVSMFLLSNFRPGILQQEYFGGDFPTFFRVGKILRNYPAEMIYDQDLNEKLHLEIRPSDGMLRLPFVNPPFIALLFYALGGLTYATAFACWLVLSAALYGAGLLLLTRPETSRPTSKPSGDMLITALLLACAFEPFIYETWLGGQLSSIGFLAVALAIFAERRERPFLSGIALALCLYKPTLLAGILPMLLLTRRIRTLLGSAMGCLLLTGFMLVTTGPASLERFIAVAFRHRALSMGDAGVFKVIKFVDLNMFSYVLAGRYSRVLLALIAPFLLYVAWRLGRFWWRTGPDPSRGAMPWALALVWGCLINIYVPIYDTVLVVIACMLAFPVALRHAHGEVPLEFRAVLALLFVTPWVSQILAATIHLQLYTLVLISLGVYLLRLSAKSGCAMVES